MLLGVEGTLFIELPSLERTPLAATSFEDTVFELSASTSLMR